jgi:hypothetical protein
LALAETLARAKKKPANTCGLFEVFELLVVKIIRLVPGSEGGSRPLPDIRLGRVLKI